jgi:hypothetical protein
VKVTKTPHRQAVLRRLADLNDEFNYLAFVEEEFAGRLAELTATEPNSFTTEAFPENTKAEGIHVTLSELAAFRRRLHSRTGSAFLSASLASVSDYLNRVRGELGDTKSLGDDGAEEALAACLDGLGAKLSPRLLYGLSYARLRRNQVVHVSPKPSAKLKTLIRTKGDKLNEEWELPILDFSALPEGTLTWGETLDLIRLLRVCVKEIDGIAAPLLDAEGILRSLGGVMLGRHPLRRGLDHRGTLFRKVSEAGRMLYGVSSESDEVADLFASDWPESA